MGCAGPRPALGFDLVVMFWSERRRKGTARLLRRRYGWLWVSERTTLEEASPWVYRCSNSYSQSPHFLLFVSLTSALRRDINQAQRIAMDASLLHNV